MATTLLKQFLFLFFLTCSSCIGVSFSGFQGILILFVTNLLIQEDEHLLFRIITPIRKCTKKNQQLWDVFDNAGAVNYISYITILVKSLALSKKNNISKICVYDKARQRQRNQDRN